MSTQPRYIKKADAHLHPELFEKQLAKQRRWRAANPEKLRLQNKRNERRRKLKRYGLTEETYLVLLLSQDSLCAICRQDNKTQRDWHVDHCHTTGEVRGILCHHCNVMLGHAKDNIQILQAAKEYLIDRSSCHT